MWNKIFTSVTILFISCSFSPLSFASNTACGQQDFETIKRDLQQILAQVDELRREHAAEIDALRRRLVDLDKRGAPSPLPGKDTLERDELEALRVAAEAEAKKEARVEEPIEETIFKSGSLGLQALNPEISITGDLLGSYRAGDAVERHTDWFFRALGIHFEAYLDPYSRFKAAVPINENGAELGEAYFTRYGVFGNVNVTLGKFRQQFGVVNRWHKHALDWFDFPVALRLVFGEGGLNQTGASLDWSGSVGSLSQEIVLQLTDGDNARMFGENSKNRPSILAHYKLYQDLSASTYVELGATGLLGWNDIWETTGGQIEETLSARVYGVDFTLAWEPTNRMRYRNLEWRSELYMADKEIQAPDGSGTDHLRPWGVYTSLQMKVSRTLDLGTRLDFYRPDDKAYAALPDLSLFPLAVTDDDANRYQLGLYATWWPSPFVKFRLGYAHQGGTGMGEDERIATFQVVFAAGPHKHERY